MGKGGGRTRLRTRVAEKEEKRETAADWWRVVDVGHGRGVVLLEGWREGGMVMVDWSVAVGVSGREAVSDTDGEYIVVGVGWCRAKERERWKRGKNEDGQCAEGWGEHRHRRRAAREDTVDTAMGRTGHIDR